MRRTQHKAHKPAGCVACAGLSATFPVWLDKSPGDVPRGRDHFSDPVGNAPGLNRGVGQVTLDGKVLPGNEIPLLSDGGQHQAHVLMG